MNLMKFKWLYFALSLLVIIPGTISLVKFGLKPAIDFTGGSLIELRLIPPEGQSVTEPDLRQVAQDNHINITSLHLTDASVLIRAASLSQAEFETFKASLSQKAAVQEVRFETVGPTLGQELLQKTITAVILAALAILLYVAYRFKSVKFGVCAVLAMLHDTLVLLGSFSLLGHFLGVEVDTLFVTAVLTILSFSVHDTIVVYDRIRESLKLHRQADFTHTVNSAVTTTLTRSVNNSMTIIFMLLSLFLLGGPTIHWFILALLIGTISGTYSSTFTAAPLLVVWENLQKKKSKL